ncbi:MAG: spore germination protein [Clostridiales bacterium]|nr:spore germination protein [Clostridiales bacterium]
MRVDLNGLKKELKTAFHNSEDLTFREFYTGGVSAAVCFIDGLVDKTSVELNIINRLMKIRFENAEQGNGNAEKENINTKNENKNTEESVFNDTEKENETAEWTQFNNTKQENETAGRTQFNNTKQENETAERTQFNNTEKESKNTKKEQFGNIENKNTEESVFNDTEKENETAERMQFNNAKQENETAERMQFNNAKQENKNTEQNVFNNTEQTQFKNAERENINTKQENENTEQNVFNNAGKEKAAAEKASKNYAESLKSIITSAETAAAETDFGALVGRIAGGEAALFIENADEFYLFAIKNQPARAISEPPTSTVLKGPREGFTEDFKVNTVLLRKRLKTEKFVIETLKIGRYTNTTVAVAHISGIADPKIVEKIKRRLENIDVDGIIDSSYLAEFLKERKYSMLKQIGVSEKPDIVAAKLLEGRVAVISDGSPIVLTIPFILLEDLQDSADYYKNDVRSFFIRLVRIFGEVLAMLLPGFYVAVLTRHYQLLPVNFLISIITSVRELPFTAEIEMIFVLLLFEILNEAGVRMPRYVGMSLSLIGAIILGDTAVKAGLISSPTVLIAAMSNIGIYCIPDEIASFSLFRLALVLASSLFGFFGLILCSIAIAAYMLTYNGYDAPYLAPFAPYIAEDIKDSIDKRGLLGMKERPRSIPNINRRRQK